MVDVQTCCIDTWTGSINKLVAARSARYEVWTVKRIMPHLNQPDDIQLTRADPLSDADVLVVDGSRIEHADSDGVEVTVSIEQLILFLFWSRGLPPRRLKTIMLRDEKCT